MKFRSTVRVAFDHPLAAVTNPGFDSDNRRIVLDQEADELRTSAENSLVPAK